MALRRPQLDSQTLHQVRWLLGGLLSLLAAWTVFYMAVEATVLLAMTTLAVPLVMWRPVLAASVPGWVHRLVFPAVVALFALDFFQARELLPAMIRLGLMLLLYRSVTLRSRREDMQLILLSLFLVVVAGVLTVSMVFVVQILLFTGCALGLMLTITLTDPAEDRASTDGGTPAWVKVEWPRVLRELLAVANWRVLALAAVLFVGVLGLSALLFLMIPRFEWGMGFFLDQMLKGKSSRSGFSETVNFGDVVHIQEDRGLALSVDVSDPGRVPATPYWRMLVLDQYARGGFMMSPGLRAQFAKPTPKIIQHQGTGTRHENAPIWTFYLESGVSRYLPLVGAYGQITFASPQSLVVNDTPMIAALPVEPAKMTAYRIEGMLPESRIEDLDLARRLRDQPQADIALKPNGQTDAEKPSGHDGKGPPMYLNLSVSAAELAQLQAWVEEIGAPRSGEVAGYVQRACVWLERRHGYALSMSLLPADGDILVRWLGSPEPGHCELFAGSLVLLCRAAGVPARVVVGFKGGVWNAGSGSITVTNANAHAWVEVYDGERYWLRADPTPGAGGLSRPGLSAAMAAGGDGAPLQLESGWAARWNGLRVFWYRRIVSFDQASQVEMMRTAGHWAEAYGKRLMSALDRRLRAAGEWVMRPWSLDRVGWAGGAVVTVALLVWGIRRLNVIAWWRSVRGVDPVRREAGRWLRRLAARGVPAGEAVRDELLRLRYGRRSTWPPSADVFRAARQALKKWLRQRPR